MLRNVISISKNFWNSCVNLRFPTTKKFYSMESRVKWTSNSSLLLLNFRERNHVASSIEIGLLGFVEAYICLLSVSSASELSLKIVHGAVAGHAIDWLITAYLHFRDALGDFASIRIRRVLARLHETPASITQRFAKNSRVMNIVIGTTNTNIAAFGFTIGQGVLWDEHRYHQRQHGENNF